MNRFICLLLVVGCFFATACGLQLAPKLEPRVAAGVAVEGVAMGGRRQDEVVAVLQDLAARRYIPPQDARFADTDGKVTPEQAGRLLDVPATAREVMAAPAGSEPAAVYRPLVPALTAAVLSVARPVGVYATPILDASPGRVENIRLTAALLNNGVIASGQEFSFNRSTGEPTPARGFKAATVFVDGRHEQEMGGGMCQVSSTLYNAVLGAGLAVVERHPHSQPVSYVPLGRDATTYTDKDLRFVNTTRHTLIIRAFIDGKKLHVDLLALPPGGA